MAGELPEVFHLVNGADRFDEHHLLGTSNIDVKLAGRDTGESVLVIEHTSRAHGGPARHLHHGQEKWFHALEGEFVVEVGEQRFRLAPGDSVLAPREIPHVWAHVGGTIGRLLIAFIPAGKMESFFADRGDQARERAAAERLSIEFIEGDAEALPYLDESFDAVVSMYGAMFAPRPEVVAAELFRVTKPGGFMAMADWTSQGFIGKMFEVFKKHLPPTPAGVPSTMLWGHEPTVRQRLAAFGEVRLERRIAAMRYPFPPAGTVDFFRRYYGPTGKAFQALDPDGQAGVVS